MDLETPNSRYWYSTGKELQEFKETYILDSHFDQIEKIGDGINTRSNTIRQENEDLGKDVLNSEELNLEIPCDKVSEERDITEIGKEKKVFNSKSSSLKYLLKKKFCFTSLNNCEHNRVVDLISVILQVNPIRKVTNKFGKELRLSSVLIGDSTKSWFSVTFWDKRAEWVEELKVGQIVLFEGFRTKLWNSKIAASSTGISKFYLLMNYLNENIKDSHFSVSVINKIRNLKEWMLKNNIDDISSSQPVKSRNCGSENSEVNYSKAKSNFFTPVRGMIKDSVINFSGMLIDFICLPGEKNKSKVGSCLLCDDEKVQIEFCFNETPYSERLLNQIKLVCNPGKIMLIRNVRVVRNSVTLQLVLEPIKNTSIDFEGILEDSNLKKNSSSIVNEIFDLSEILVPCSSGKRFYKVNGVFQEIQFSCAHEHVISLSSSIDCVKDIKVECVVYLGCCNCRRELHKDSNQIRSCKDCPFPTSPTDRYKYYYRPLVGLIQSNNSTCENNSENLREIGIKVQIESDLVKEILGGCSPSLFSSLDSNFVESVIQLLFLLVNGKNSGFSLEIGDITTIDENGVPSLRYFTLESFQTRYSKRMKIYEKF